MEDKNIGGEMADCFDKIIETSFPNLNKKPDKLQRLVEACTKAAENMEHPAVECREEWQTGMFCGLEDRNITDRYDACMYGYECAIKKVNEWVISAITDALDALEEEV